MRMSRRAGLLGKANPTVKLILNNDLTFQISGRPVEGRITAAGADYSTAGTYNIPLDSQCTAYMTYERSMYFYFEGVQVVKGQSPATYSFQATRGIWAESQVAASTSAARLCMTRVFRLYFDAPGDWVPANEVYCAHWSGSPTYKITTAGAILDESTGASEWGGYLEERPSFDPTGFNLYLQCTCAGNSSNLPKITLNGTTVAEGTSKQTSVTYRLKIDTDYHISYINSPRELRIEEIPYDWRPTA